MLIIHTTPPRSTADFVMGGVRDLLLISGALWARYRMFGKRGEWLVRSAGIAEFVLSCVLPPDRAAAVTGDLLEEAEARGLLVLEFHCPYGGFAGGE